MAKIQLFKYMESEGAQKKIKQYIYIYTYTGFVVQGHILQMLLVNTLISRLTSEMSNFNQPLIEWIYIYMSVFNNQAN